MMGLIKAQQGEIWLVKFDPKIANEIAKTRPAIIVSNDLIHEKDLVFVVPITSWQDKFQKNLFFIELIADDENCLTKDSFANCSQIKSFSFKRLMNPIGRVNNEIMDLIKQTILLGLQDL